MCIPSPVDIEVEANFFKSEMKQILSAYWRSRIFTTVKNKIIYFHLY